MVRKLVSLVSATLLLAAATAWAGSYFIYRVELGGNPCYRYGYTARDWMGVATVYPSGLLRLQYYGDNPGVEHGFYSRPAPVDPDTEFSKETLRPQRHRTPKGSIVDLHLGWVLAVCGLLLELTYVAPRFIRRRRFRRLQCLRCGADMSSSQTRRCGKCRYDNPYIVIERPTTKAMDAPEVPSQEQPPVIS